MAGSEQLMQETRAALTGAMGEIFSTMFGTEMQSVPHEQIVDGPGLTSIIGFGGQLSGFIAMHFSQEMACRVATGLLGFELAAVDESVCDAMAEVCNMVAGSFKNRLSSTEERFKISLPSVINGTDYMTRKAGQCEELWVGIVSGDCRFKIQLVLENKN